jgi:hypothetical protein
MSIAWDKVLPVIVSILIIIAVALLREKSPSFSAIAATMPINIPLGMWIVYATATDKNTVMQGFTTNVMINMIPTMVFAGVVMLATRMGLGLIACIIVGYIGWGVTFVLVSVIKHAMGIE